MLRDLKRLVWLALILSTPVAIYLLLYLKSPDTAPNTRFWISLAVPMMIVPLLFVLASFQKGESSIRRRLPRDWARRRGFKFVTPTSSSRAKRLIASLRRFSKDQIIFVGVKGKIGHIPFWAGELKTRRRSPTGQSDIVEHGVIALLDIPCIFKAQVHLRPESRKDKGLAELGFEDIDFEFKQFSDAFFVSSTNRRLAHDIFRPKMMEFLLPHKEIVLDIFDDALLISFAKHDAMSTEKLDYAIAVGTGVLRNFPRHVLQEAKHYWFESLPTPDASTSHPSS